MKKFWGVMLLVMVVDVLSVFSSGTANAVPSSITLSIDNASIGVDVVPQVGGGTFAKSSASNISVVTNNATGYTLSIKANNSTDLVNIDDNTKVIPSIGSAVSESDFMSDPNYANMWGYSPSKINSLDNTDFLPSPSTAGDVIDATTAANADANNYTMVLGTKITNDATPGIYNNSFTVMAIANPLTYSVNYTNKSGVTATNMPANVVDAVTGAGEGVFTISSTVPTRTGYTFNKWCTVEPTTTAGTDVCTGGAEYASGTDYELDATTNPQTVTLYAMWTLNSYSVTVNFAGSGVSGVTLSNTTYGGGGTVSTSGGTVSLKQGVSYNISGTYASGYEFSSWATGANGTLGSTSSASTTYTVTGASTLTLTGKQSCTPFPTNTAMQSFTGGNYCVNSGTLIDNRDNQSYHVAKLDDGKWWLLDNLALDLVAKKSVLSSSNTHASDTTLSYLKNGGGSTSDKYATAGVANWTSSSSYSAPLVNLTNKDVIPSDATSQAGQYKVGGYYNYCAASAGSYCYGDGTSPGISSGNATEDICPKGWRLPTSSTTGEYQALYNNASYNTYANYRSALRLPLSGYFSNGSAVGQDSYGYFWSSTYCNNYSPYNLHLRTSDVRPSYGNNRNSGHSVRCVLGS